MLIAAVADGLRLGASIIRRRTLMIVALALALVVLFAPTARAAGAEDSDEVKELLRAGDKFLIAGRSSYPDAVGKYSSAINLAPDSPKVIFRRADLYFMMKRWSEAKEDLRRVLGLDKTHKKALDRYATLLAAEGLLLEAARSYQQLSNALKAEGNDKKAQEVLAKAKKAQSMGTTWSDLQKELASTDREVKRSASQRCVAILATLISEFAKDNAALRLRRAECAVTARNQQAAGDEIKFLLTRDAQNLKAVALNAKSLRQMGSIEGAKREIKRCLALDPEDPGCVALHKSMKSYGKITDSIKAHVEQKQWDNAIIEIDACLAAEEDPPNLEELWNWKCDGYTEQRDAAKGIKACLHTVDLLQGGGTDEGMRNPEGIRPLINLFELHIMDENMEAAEDALNKATKVSDTAEKVKNARQKLELLKKNKDRKDYYAILGVSKTASNSEIKKAYKKLAKKYHPDHLRSKDVTDKERETNDKRFRDINEAKEALLNEEKRRRFDNGEDVTKPPEQQGHHFHHGSPFDFPGFQGGGGFNFQFH